MGVEGMHAHSFNAHWKIWFLRLHTIKTKLWIMSGHQCCTIGPEPWPKDLGDE